MVSSEVQRTLVKSPPELWAELSDPVALARHLGALGEIRITHIEPEQKVEWEADGTTGAVSIKPSGWGTKVTICATRELDPAAEATDTTVAAATPEAATPEAATRETDGVEPTPAVAPEPLAAECPAAEPPLPAADPEPDIRAAEPAEREPAEANEAAVSEPPADQADQRPEPRRGFFARLFRRREPRPSVALETSAAHAALSTAPEPIGAVPEPIAVAPAYEEHATPEPDPLESLAAEIEQPGLEQAATPADARVQETVPAEETTLADTADREDLAVELHAAEEVTEEQVRAVLTAVLDRLGAAHHRPFSRS